MICHDIEKDLVKVSSKEKAQQLQRFFKTGRGEYGEGDVFVGITVPNIRKVCRKYYNDISLGDLDFFVMNDIHEYRMFGLLCLTYKFDVGSESERREIFNYYLKNTRFVNNWDLVDATASKIAGAYLEHRGRDVLYELLDSTNMWEQRIAVVATHFFIKKGDFEEILYFAKHLLDHKHDLIHKSVGWMLREVGKRDLDVLRQFLNTYVKQMPRTMLRYSIEKMEEEERLSYLRS